MKTLSKTYREWSLDDWCHHVKALNVDTLTAWSNVSRSSYNHAVVLGKQRKVARLLGWLPKLEKNELESLSDEDYIKRFKAMGVKTISDMWRGAQHWCEYLRKTNRLETIAEKMGFGYIHEYHPCCIDYYLNRCRMVGDLSAWCQLDKNAAEAARKHGLMDELRIRAPIRPRRGYPSSGGYCRSLSELAVARLFEANSIEFVTQLDYPFTFPRGRRQKCKSDFYLSKEGAYIEIWGIPANECDPFWETYQTRRNFKLAMCRRINLRLIEIEGYILFRQGPEAFMGHVMAVLSSAGLPLRKTTDRWTLLDPQGVNKEVSDGK